MLSVTSLMFPPIGASKFPASLLNSVSFADVKPVVHPDGSITSATPGPPYEGMFVRNCSSWNAPVAWLCLELNCLNDCEVSYNYCAHE